MSKKRILSNGHSSYWRDDIKPIEPKVYTEEEQRFRDAFNSYNPEENQFFLYCGPAFLKAFDQAIKEEINYNLVFR